MNNTSTMHVPHTNTASMRIECHIDLKPKKVVSDFQSILADRPTLSEPFGINYNFVTYITTYLYGCTSSFFFFNVDRQAFFLLVFKVCNKCDAITNCMRKMLLHVRVADQARKELSLNHHQIG